jgi:hypothetical protein
MYRVLGMGDVRGVPAGWIALLSCQVNRAPLE